ncbi:hypothetical protein DDZ13_00760 [Coraliomargarita sinensis]|uniref:Alginate export domain-containing protein n=1 Tax=Coraliomargarita sinensis TaxID=2174842 RepID=A0A317ZPU8_9BACT|nr:hypothetical protein [Coraliomargarita sinensis]PXA05431.1 hypothetical protein DDZ13_00760 [Coraliomargarita sinensis]
MKFRIIACSLACVYSLNASQSLLEWWEAHGDYSIRNISSAFAQHYAAIPLNQDNLFDIPEYRLQNEFRPEARIETDRFYAYLAPRFVAWRDYYKDGTREGEEDSDNDTYLHEWTLRFFPTPWLSLSYAREDLQWGPAFLLSPSNPFDSKNGRSEPKDEVDAADFLQASWTIDDQWSLTAIANIDDGRKEYRIRPELRQDFRDIYALKLDYLFDRGHAALVASTMEDAEAIDERLGYYLSYNLDDAWILYSEGSFSTEDEEMLAGASYTFGNGLMLAAEYFYNSSGIDDPLPETLPDLEPLADFALSQSNRESFFRENYLLLQAYHNDLVGGADGLLRYTHNLDDQSRSLLGHIEMDLCDNALFFTSATINSSGGGELDSFREYWVQAGIELFF